MIIFVLWHYLSGCTRASPESQLVIFEESGHLPWLEEPNAFFAELERFLIS